MSAIYGAIDLSKKKIDKNFRQSFKDYYSKYKIDRLDDIEIDNAVFGCGIQYFNEEAKRETLPFFDKENGYLFTADCVLDNREDLCQLLNLPNDTPDGKVLYESYLKWNKDCFTYVRGVFSFVLYDTTNNTILLASDHFSTRCLFYYRHENTVFFSTLFFPILEKTGIKFHENERWIIDCLTFKAPVMITEPKETAVQNVYKVVSGTYVTFELDSKKEKEVRYFNPKDLYKTNWSITLSQSEEMVKEVMHNTVKSILRPNIQYGAQLSQGLDSSTVACLAARELAKENRCLRSYTSIPLKEASLNNSGHLVYDETEGVKKIVEAYPNIVPSFLDCKDRFFLNEVDKIIDIWEMPCKSQQNSIWTDEIAKISSEDGCKILFTGATGNCTISAGYTEYTFFHYLKRLNIKKAYETLNIFNNSPISKKRYVKNLFKSLINFYTWYFKKEAKNCYKETLINQKLADKYNTKRRFNKQICHMFPIATMNEMRRQMYMVNANAQIGEIETKYSLNYGVLHRDPLRTVDVIKMCMTLPVYCYASSDFDRRLVRVGMKGIVPKEIREDVFHRGRQSGDNDYRLRETWNDTLPDIEATMNETICRKYISTTEKDRMLNILSDKDFGNHSAQSFMLINSYVLCKYLVRIGINL